MKNSLLTAFLLLINHSLAMAQAPAPACPVLPEAPPCPTTSSTIVDESYPAMAYVVSSNDVGPQAAQLPATFVDEIFRGHPGSTSVPIIMVPDSPENFILLQNDLRDRWTAAGVGDAEIKARMGRIRSIPTARPYTWQQDYFESFIDPATGRPSVRRVEEYDRSGVEEDSVTGMPAASGGAACGVSQGPPLASFSSPSHNDPDAESGGNIEGLPNGLCMMGNNQNPQYTAQYCANAADRVVVETSWLTVGHADEIITAVPQVPRTGACPYTFMFASPRKGMELLAASPNDLFLDIGTVTPQPGRSITETQRELAQERILNNGSLSRFGMMLCHAYSNSILPGRSTTTPPATVPGASGGARRAMLNLIERGANMLVPPAAAGVGLVMDDDVQNCLDHAEELATITNREMLAAFATMPELTQYNQLVQEKMDENKRRVRARYPQCADSNFKDVPDIFMGFVVEGSSPMQLASKTGSSMFPNPTNGVMAGNSFIFPDPQNAAFRRYLSNNVLTGVTPRFVNTWDYAHELEGNMHCSSHAIRYCRPAATGVSP
jgi:hypothetical protein